MSAINKTHDINLKSWVDSANQAGTDFPIQNLPFAIFRRKGGNEEFRGGVAIGDHVLDLNAVINANILQGDALDAATAANAPALNEFMGMGKQYWSALRLALSDALSAGSEHQAALESTLVAQNEVEYSMPCHIGDYTAI